MGQGNGYKMINLYTDKVKFLINSKGLKINWIAKEIGISRTYLELLLFEKRNPSLEVLKKLAKVLKVSRKEIGEKCEKAIKGSNVSTLSDRLSPVKSRRNKSAS